MSSDRTTVAALVPAWNERDRIFETVRALNATGEIDEIIVVDDGSDDGTLERAVDAGARVHRLPRRMGKGTALRVGLRQTDAAVLVLIDADLGATASLAGALLQPILADAADMTVAAPPPSGPSGFGLVEGLARWGVRRLAAVHASRPLSGQRALRREIADRFGFASGFAVETALTIDAVRAGYRVVEVSCELEHAKTRRDLRGFAHRARQGADVARAIASRAVRRHW